MLAFPRMNRYVVARCIAALLAAFLEDAASLRPIRASPSASSSRSPRAAATTTWRASSASASPDSLGQPVLVDNRPGAGGVVGAELAAKSAPDGYTLFLGGVGSHAINPNLHEKLPYDPIKDFAPVELLAQAPLILVVHPSVPARDIAEFIAYARAHPGSSTSPRTATAAPRSSPR